MSKLPSNCMHMYNLTKVSIVHPFLSCLEKEGFTFDVSFSLKLCATSYTLPYLLSFLTSSWYPPLCDAINMLSGLSFCHFLHVHQMWRCWLFTFNCLQYFIKHFQSIWGLGSVIVRSQLGASAGKIRVNKHLPGCITEGIYFRKELQSCLCA